MGMEGAKSVVLHPACTTRKRQMEGNSMAIDGLDDKIAAAAFRRLVAHLQHRTDAQNVDLMGLAGFCRNCLADWVREADGTMDKEMARTLIYGMAQEEWKARYQTPATPEQIAKMNESLAKNTSGH
jgi:uncharacterized protein